MKRRILTIYLALFAFVLCEQSLYANESEAKRKGLRGFDISHFNGEVSWETVSQSGLHFVVLKATEGIDWVDPTFEEHWKNAKQHGFVRGAYHFYVSHDDPTEEANWYIQNVKLSPGDLPPIVDVERADKKDLTNLAANLEKFVDQITKHYGVRPIIYTGPNFWSSSINKPFPDHHLWIADYGVEQPILPSGWDRWTFWQYSQEGELAGVEKAVDFNTFSGTEKELETLLLKKE